MDGFPPETLPYHAHRPARLRPDRTDAHAGSVCTWRGAGATPALSRARWAVPLGLCALRKDRSHGLLQCGSDQLFPLVSAAGTRFTYGDRDASAPGAPDRLERCRPWVSLGDLS